MQAYLAQLAIEPVVRLTGVLKRTIEIDKINGCRLMHIIENDLSCAARLH